MLTAVDGQAITYDGSGNPLSYYNGYRYTFAWEQGRQLDSLTYNGHTTSYQYDYNGIRTKKIKSDGSYVVYDIVDGTAVGETHYTSTGTATMYMMYIHDENGAVNGIGLWYPGNTEWTYYYFVKNLQGDVLEIYGENHSCVASYTYDSWGNILSKSGSLADINPFRYRGYYFDTESWFYYLQSRYYDPAIGRFINADVLTSTGQGIQGNNMFAYCGNNPVNNYDPSGNRHAICIEVGGSFPNNTMPVTDATESPESVALSEMRERGIAFYNGVPITKVNEGNSAFTFGYIFMGANCDENLLRHEYGHIMQLHELGVYGYTVFIVAPSITGYGIDMLGLLPNGMYYSLPWEYKADEYGGASHNYKPWAKSASDMYWHFAKTMTDYLF